MTDVRGISSGFTDTQSFQEVIVECLRQSGALGKLQAHIRSAVLDVIHETNPEKSELTRVHAELTEGTNPNTALAFELVLDLLHTYDMTSVGAVEVELPQQTVQNHSRSKVARALGIPAVAGESLLVTLLNQRNGTPSPASKAGPKKLVASDSEDEDVSCSDHTARTDDVSELMAMEAVVEVNKPNPVVPIKEKQEVGMKQDNNNAARPPTSPHRYAPDHQEESDEDTF
eukprot:PhF_6_TR8681/c0_g1_i3/m.13594